MAQGDKEDYNAQLVGMEDTREGNQKLWQAKLSQTMMDMAGHTPEHSDFCMQHSKKTFKDRVAEEAKKVAKKVFKG